jgi:hypothetical protein
MTLVAVWLSFRIENSIRLPGTYDPSTKKTYFEVLKIFGKKFYMYIS